MWEGKMEWHDVERRLQLRHLDRRSMLKALASVGLGVAVMSTTRNRAFAADQVSVYTWTTYNDPKLYKDYVDKHGSPNISFFGDTDEAFSKLAGGYKVDIAHPCADDMARWQKSGMIQPF